MSKLTAAIGAVALSTFGVFAGVATVLSSPAQASSTFVVNTTADENGSATDCTDNNPATTCSIREALAAATTDGDVVQLAAVSYQLTLGELVHGDTSVTIQGPALDFTDATITAQSGKRVLVQGSGGLALSGITLQEGSASSVTSEDGGCLQAQGNVDLNAVNFSSCQVYSDNGTSRGGAVYAAGTVTAANSSFSGSNADHGDIDLFHAYGGAIYGGSVTLVNCQIFDNYADEGGAVWGENGVNVTGSSFSQNNGSSDGSGGAVGTFRDALVEASQFNNNYVGTSGNGGAVYAAANLVLNGSAFVQNTANHGGAAYAGTSLQGFGIQVTGNQATGITPQGGGLASAGTVTLSGSTVSGNAANWKDSFIPPGAEGGGIWAGGDVSLTSSTVSGNSAASRGTGGGVYSDGNVTLDDSTVSGNTAANDPNTYGTGGGISAAQVTLKFSTVAGNVGRTGANLATRSLTSSASVVAYPGGGGTDCVVGATTSVGYSYDDDGSCGFTGAHDTSRGPDPQLGALADNGGPTQTMHPAVGSPLVNAIPSVSCTGCDGTDQRGVTRPQGSGYDIGAVEVIAVTVNPRFTG